MKKKVSVIIPVYNDPDGIQSILNALIDQTYPKQNYEIIVVDNGSTDDTVAVSKVFREIHPELIRVLVEDTLKSSYAARNKGIAVSNGEIIAMIDADCTPIQEWLENGVLALDKMNADMVGGKVEFFFSSIPSAAEMYDSLTNMQMKQNIETRGVAKTANLFSRRVVFDAIGNFPSDFISGGDVFWTEKATSAGYTLIYSDNVKVLHPTRKLGALINKQIRVGRGQVAIWKNSGLQVSKIAIKIFRSLFPWRIRTIRNLIEEKGNQEMEKYLISIWFVSWLCKVAINFGRIRALLDFNSENSMIL